MANKSIAGVNGKRPGGVVRVNSKGGGSGDDVEQPIVAPYCNISDAQFSFHGHRDSVRFFLNVPNLTIQKTSSSSSTTTTAINTATAAASSVQSPSKLGLTGGYEKAETLLVLSGGHGYIDFRIGDTTASSKKPGGSIADAEDVKAASGGGNNGGAGELATDDQNALKKNDRAYLIVWQINNE